MKKHILLRGQRGIGKSTLIRRLLEAADLYPGGFYTKMDKNPGELMHPIYIYPASLPIDQRKRGEENLVGRCGQQGRFKEIYPVVFDTLGAAYLQPAPCQVVVMDELGFMESEAQVFRAAVLRALEGEVPVLAAVKDRMDVPFLRQVCAHPQAEVVDIDAQNRDALFETLLPIVKSWK